jgi:uncharacterized protein (DUF4415 family)
MKQYPVLTEFVEGRGYTREQWEEDDNPELTDEELARMRPIEEVLPWLHAAAVADKIRRQGERGKQKKPTKVYINIGLDKDVVDKFKAGGRGWQTRINEALRTIP